MGCPPLRQFVRNLGVSERCLSQLVNAETFSPTRVSTVDCCQAEIDAPQVSLVKVIC